MLNLNVIFPIISNNTNKFPITLNIIPIATATSTTDCDGKCGQGKVVNRRWKCPHNNLAVKYPNIAAEWDNMKNGNKKPEDYGHGSGEMIYWRCNKEGVCECHTWPSRIADRTRGSGCPFCANGIPCIHNNLLVNRPEIAKEWDYTKNSKRPEEYSECSGDCVWWICFKEGVCECHRWQAQIRNRTGKNESGCPFCNAGKPCNHYNLQIQYPNIAAGWDYENNIGSPQDYSPHSIYYASWKCDNKGICDCHRWQTSISDRTRDHENGCPFCNIGRPCKHYNLQVLYPDIAAQWDYDKNIGNPQDYAPHSSYYASWKCDNKGLCNCHRWQTSISNRTARTGCPFCSNPPLKVCIHKNLATEHPELMNEWDYELNDKRPETYHRCSGKDVWWKCSRNLNKPHSYLARIDHRTYSKSRCPCYLQSHGENKITGILTKLNIRFEPQWNEIIELGRKKFDFFLIDDGEIIEYDGLQHFEICFFCRTPEKLTERKQVDIEKQNEALRLGYKIIRIDYTIPLDNIESHIIRALDEKKLTYYSTPRMYQWLIDAEVKT